MEGAAELAEKVFQMPIRLSLPDCTKGMSDIVDNPIYSTSVGLLVYGSKEAEVTEISKRMMSKTQTKREASVLAPKEIGPSFSATKVWQKLKHWFQSYI